MLVSQLIKNLTELQQKHGDLEVVVNHDYTEHDCSEDGCHCLCSSRPHILSLYPPVFNENIHEKKRREFWAKKPKNKKPVILIETEE